MKTVIIGAGSWGTALSVVLNDAGHDVILWAREPEIADSINRENRNQFYLPHLTLAPAIKANLNIRECIKDRNFIVFATPSHAIRSVAEKIKPMLTGDEIIVNVAKGIEQESFLTPTQILSEVLGDVINEDHIGVLYGPSHAEEVCEKKPTTVVSAANSKSTAKLIQQVFSTSRFRVYVNHDMLGVEIAGSVKNVIAIAAGACDGAGLGDNAVAALLTRGLIEIKRLGMKLGASSDTFSGLAGIGDMIVTCTSKHSRNRFVGYEIGKGKKLDEIIKDMNMVAEGVKTTQSVYGMAQKLGVEMPITEAVYRVLFENVPPDVAVSQLMTRDLKDEIII